MGSRPQSQCGAGLSCTHMALDTRLRWRAVALLAPSQPPAVLWPCPSTPRGRASPAWVLRSDAAAAVWGPDGAAAEAWAAGAKEPVRRGSFGVSSEGA